MLENAYKSTNELVSRGQTAVLLQGVIALSISARKIYFTGALLKAITLYINIAVWPRMSKVVNAFCFMDHHQGC